MCRCADSSLDRRITSGMLTTVQVLCECVAVARGQRERIGFWKDDGFGRHT
jgi:hypothetical protein